MVTKRAKEPDPLLQSIINKAFAPFINREPLYDGISYETKRVRSLRELMVVINNPIGARNFTIKITENDH